MEELIDLDKLHCLIKARVFLLKTENFFQCYKYKIEWIRDYKKMN